MRISLGRWNQFAIPPLKAPDGQKEAQFECREHKN